jgi:hypothetical protein
VGCMDRATHRFSSCGRGGPPCGGFAVQVKSGLCWLNELHTTSIALYPVSTRCLYAVKSRGPPAPRFKTLLDFFGPRLECAPDGGQDHAAFLTVCRA